MLLDDLFDLISPNVSYPIHKGFLQPLPDTAYALHCTGGYASEYVFGAQPSVLEQPTVQVVARAKDYQTGMAAITAAHDFLDGLREQTVNNVLYHFFQALQPPFFLMRDDNNRFIFAFNVHIQRRSVP